jgi:DMSO/TMAO reductase YedYZ molybdopterin-dependent catalytic subunit
MKRRIDRHDPDRPRLPPGQTLAKKWPVLHYGDVPAVSLEAFRLRLWGAVAKPVEWSWADLQALPHSRRRTDLHCVTTWSCYDMDWDGILFRDVAAVVAPLPEARHVLLHGLDGYTTNVPLKTLLDDDVMLVWAWNGEPLSAEHGGPLRMVVPNIYAWKSAKWLCGIEVLTHDRRGFWEERGYHNRADPWLDERYSSQERGDESEKDADR